MKILVINCGSSTLKFQVIEIKKGQENKIARGIVERIGKDAEINFSYGKNTSLNEKRDITDHSEASGAVLKWLESINLLKFIKALGHRVVHGGYRFTEPTLINDEVINAIEALAKLAPLHNKPSLMSIQAFRKVLGAAIPMAAVFDTAFHSNMPERAFYYAIPMELSEKHHIRRYGFHGIAHQYMAERYADIASMPVKNARLITLQLGNGCSAAAVSEGLSIDTSMGFTPLEGLMMGTRSGDVDPHLPGFLSEYEGVSIKEAEELLNRGSGLLGVSGVSQDMRELIKAEKEGNERAAFAVNMFCYRVRKQIGAYLAALNGADAVIFGGGIGENSPEVRFRICAGMEWAGLILNNERNNSAIGADSCISSDNSRLRAYVISVDEELIIARDTVRCLSGF